MTRCSIIIPVHNRASLTRQCLDTLLEMPYRCPDVEVIVVDDASTDTTPVLLASYGTRIRTIAHATNTGFAISCNDGAATARGDYLIFLNNDTIPQPGWLDALVDYADRHPAAAVVGSKLVFPDGTIQHAGVVICQDRNPRHIYAGFPADHPAVNRSRRFQIVTGACMLVRRALFDQLGGFDTIFVNGHEDVDLCLRLGELGHEIHYCHESELIHLESVSRGYVTPQSRENGRRYVQRWHHRVQPDDLRYYVEDGLLGLRYAAMYPLTVSISPLLGGIDGDQRSQAMTQLLMARSRQVLDLLRDNISLNVRVREAELDALERDRNHDQGHAPWTTNGAAVQAPATEPVSIVVPAFGTDEELRRTLESVIAHTDLAVHQLVIVGGERESERIIAALDAVARQAPPVSASADDRLTLAFARSLNQAMQESAGDIVLLHTATTVTAGWIDRMQRAADARPRIASVTPLADDAEVCPVPAVVAHDGTGPGLTASAVAEFISRSSLRLYPELPAAGGRCSYLARDALRAVGLFDDARFGTGPGAELDWCLRARTMGFTHILDDATFVAHHGSAGRAARSQDQEADLQLLDQLYPAYRGMLRASRANDSLQRLEAYIALGLQLIQDRPTAR